jgi:Contractile injection system tube protein
MANLQQRNPVRGFLVSVGLDPEILVQFQYNPDKVTDKHQISYATLNAPGMLMPVRQYSAGGERTLSFTVIVDGLFKGPADDEIDIARDERGGIAPELNKYRAFVYPQTERWQDANGAPDGFAGLYAGSETVFTAPPACRFGFGERFVDCVITEVQITDQLYNPDLDPVRAEVQVTCVELTPYNADAAGGGAF